MYEYEYELPYAYEAARVESLAYHPGCTCGEPGSTFGCKLETHHHHQLMINIMMGPGPMGHKQVKLKRVHGRGKSSISKSRP